MDEKNKKNIIAPAQAVAIDIDIKSDIYIKQNMISGRYDNPSTVLLIGSSKESVIYALDTFMNMYNRDIEISSAIDKRIEQGVGIFQQAIIQPASDEPADIEIRDFVDKVLKNIPYYIQKIQFLLKSIFMGFSVLEMVFKYEENSLVIDNLIAYPSQLFCFDENFQLAYLKDGFKLETINSSKFIIHKNKGTDFNPYGVSILTEGIFDLYWTKKWILKDWKKLSERTSVPIPKFTYESHLNKDDIASIDNIIRNFNANIGIKLPAGIDLELLNVDISSNTDQQERFIEFINKSMRIAILGQTLTSDVSKNSGSKAQGQIHQDEQDRLIKKDINSLLDTLNMTLIKLIVDLNYPNIIKYPFYVLQEEKNENITENAAIFDVAMNKLGLQISENEVYEKLGIQKPSKDDIILGNASNIENTNINDVKNNNDVTNNDNNVNNDNKITNNDKNKNINFIDLAKQSELRHNDIFDILENWNKYEVDKSIPLFKSMLNSILDSINNASNLENLNYNRINYNLSKQDMKSYQDLLTNVIFNTYLLGRYKVQLETISQIKSFAETEINLTKPFTFEEAVAYFKDKLVLTSEEVSELIDKIKARVFYVSKASEQYVIEKYYQELQKAIENGTTLEDFKKEMKDFYTQKGLSEVNPLYLETVFRTNVLGAYSAGRYEQMMNPSVLKVFGYWQFLAVGDNRTRPTHLARNGITLPAADKWWDSNYPPLDYNCRCVAVVIKTSEVEKGNEIVTNKASSEFKNVTEPTGFGINYAKEYFNYKKLKKDLGLT
jgi:SPP1 gp7 family putative phage head morphogenesis protein